MPDDEDIRVSVDMPFTDPSALSHPALVTGKSYFDSTPGNTFTGSRYEGPTNIPYPSGYRPASTAAGDAAAAIASVDPSMNGDSAAWIDPTSNLGIYTQYRNKMTDVREDLAADFVNRGMGNRIGSDYFEGVLQQAYVAHGLAEPEYIEPPTAYQLKVQQAKKIKEIVQNEFAENGKFAAIGGAEFNDTVRSRMVEAGLAEAPEPAPTGIAAFFGNEQSRLSFGYSVMQTAEQGSAAYARLANGQYYTPEQQSIAAGSLAPGVGGLAGAVIGAATPLGPIGGAMIGTGIGTIAQNVAAPYFEREQTARITAESLNQVAGNTADGFERLKSALENLNAPVQQVAQGLEVLQNLNPNLTAGSVTSAGRVAGALGNFYNADTSTIGNFFASHPIEYRAAQSYASNQSGFTPSQYQNEAGLALLEGDMATYESARRDAARMANPEAARVSNLGFLGRIGYNLSHINWREQLNPFHMPTDPSERAINEANRTLTSYQSPDDASMFTATTAARGEQAFSERQVGLVDTELQRALLTGASPSAVQSIVNDHLRIATQGLTGADAGMVGQSDALINRLQTQLRTLKPGTDDYAKVSSQLSDAYSERNRFTAEANEAELGLVQGVRQSALYGLETTEANYNRRLTQARIGGAGESTLIGQTRAYADYLIGAANNPNNDLTPAERDRLRQQASTDYYQERLAVYGQEESQISTNVARASAGVTRAEVSGTPESVRQAQTTEISRLIDLQQQYTEELRKGGLAVDDRLQKERELTGVNQQIVQEQAVQRQQFYESTAGNITASLNQDIVAGSFASVARGNVAGSAYSHDTMFESALGVENARDALRKAPYGTEEWRRAVERLNQAQQSEFDTAITVNTYRPSASASNRYGTDIANFQIAANIPFLDGPDSNPFTRGMTVLGDIREQERGYNQTLASIRSQVAKGTWQGPEGSADQAILENTQKLNELRVQESEMQRARYTAMFQAVPEMVEGQVGGGMGVAIAPFAALSAAFSPNPYLTGSFRSSPAGAYSPAPVAGGSAGGFTSSATDPVVSKLDELIRAVRDTKAQNASGPPAAIVGPLTNQQQQHYLPPYSR